MQYPSSNPIRAVIKTLALIGWMGLWFFPIVACYLLKWHRIRMRMIQFFYKGAARIVGLQVHSKGVSGHKGPLLVVSNHASYTDVFVLGQLFPVSFTPKREVRSWPIVGFLCVLADCVFVERKPSHMQQARQEMEERLARGQALCIFPEGTTNNGQEILPFKSGFFSLAEQMSLPVQPITITYTKLNGQVIEPAFSDYIAWVGEATFFGHFGRFLGFSRIDVEVNLHPVFRPNEYEDRKALSAACEVVIKRQLLANISAAKKDG